MPQRTVVVGSSVGLHARPAALIAKAAGALDADVYLSTPGQEAVDASSAMMIMTLGAEHGQQVTVESDDPRALDRIAAMVESDLDA